MNPMWLGERIPFGLLGLLLALPGSIACSGQDSTVNASEAGSSHSAAGTLGVAGISPAAGLGGASSVDPNGTAAAAGAFGLAGSVSSAAAGATSSGGEPGTGGRTGASAGGTAGIAVGSAGQSSSGLGGMTGSAGSSAAFARVSTILGNNCGIKGCHADKQSPHFVPGAMLYATLTGPNTVLAECGYTKLVEAGDPAKSAIVRLMNRKCDDFIMPPTCNKTTCLAEADLKALSDWIQAGAPP